MKLISGLVLIFVAHSAAAQEADWRYKATLYGWFPGLTASLRPCGGPGSSGAGRDKGDQFPARSSARSAPKGTQAKSPRRARRMPGRDAACGSSAQGATCRGDTSRPSGSRKVTGPSIAPSACTVSRPCAQSRVRRVMAGAGASGGGQSAWCCPLAGALSRTPSEPLPDYRPVPGTGSRLPARSRSAATGQQWPNRSVQSRAS